jgi:hypothetical protein
VLAIAGTHPRGRQWSYLDQSLGPLSTMSIADDLPQLPDAQYRPVLARGMLVHGAQWGTAGETLRRQLEIDGLEARKELVQCWATAQSTPRDCSPVIESVPSLSGHHPPSTGQRRTFSYLLPPSLSATTLWRRLTVTLAWISPVNTRSQKYRMARLQLAPPTTELGLERVEAPHYAASCPAPAVRALSVP